MGPQQKPIGGDTYHPSKDKLWDSKEVKAFLFPRRKMSKEERVALAKKKKEAKNRAYYKEKKAKYDEIKRENEKRIAAGTMTKEESLKELERYAIGWYKTIHDNESVAGDYNYLLGQIAVIFGKYEKVDGVDIMKPRLELQWPTVPSEEAYLYFVLHLIPLDHLLKICDPYDPSVLRIIMAIFHPDYDRLSSWFFKTEKEAISPIANACVTLIRNKKISKSEQRNRLNKWQKLRTEFILTLCPLSSEIPPFVFKMALNFAFDSYNREGNKNPATAGLDGINVEELARDVSALEDDGRSGGGVVDGPDARVINSGGSGCAAPGGDSEGTGRNNGVVNGEGDGD